MIHNNDGGNYRKLIIVLVAVVAVFFISLFVSSIWTKDNFASQLIAALLSAIVTALITLLLLNGQSEQEEKIDRSSKVFEEQLRIYQDFLRTLAAIVKKGKVEPSDEVELELQTAFLAMHTSPDNILDISGPVNNIIMSIKKDEDHNLLDELFQIIKVLRRELYDKRERKDDNKYDDALSQFQAILVKPQSESIDIYERATRIKALIPRNEIGINRQWIWQGSTLVHEAYLDGRNSNNNLASDLSFYEDGSASLVLFTRQNDEDQTRTVLKDKSIWGDTDEAQILKYGRYPYKAFPAGTSDKEIADFMIGFVKKMVQYRNNHSVQNN